MPRKRWIYPAGGGEPFEVDENYTNPKAEAATNGLLWNDRMYQDDNDPRYHSRKSHREFMRRNGLTTMDDFTGFWEREEKKRQEIRQGKDPERKKQLVEAVHRLRSDPSLAKRIRRQYNDI